ncbi:hypothetical protein H8356DRAFT_1341511 [Neocallimastix lanati (nom. inval.)]|nr:hypothetical protein H8356DRAFT_1341511 [Neocallimastix sp. JGI-2020a]
MFLRSMVVRVTVTDTELTERVGYILLNCNPSENYTIARKLVRNSIGKLRTGETPEEVVLVKFSVIICMDNSAFIKKDVCDYLNISTAGAVEERKLKQTANPQG